MFGSNKYVNTAITLSTTLTVVLSAAIPPVFAQARFNDVESSYWASQYVQSLSQANIISGFPDGTFRPGEQMTRAQFASVLSGAFPLPAVRAAKTFSDVPADHWAAGAISSAYAKGFLSGYPDGTFGLDQPITRLEVLVSLTNGLGLKTTGDVDKLLGVFADKGEIPDWARGAIATATDKQLMVNYPNVNQLNPGRNATRAEIAAIAYQALVNSGRVSAIASPYVPVVAATPAVELPVAQAPVDEFSELVALLNSNEAARRKAAADALAARGTAAVPQLAKALESDSAPTRAAAAYALNKIGPSAAAATPTLLNALKDNDEIVRALATSTLAQVGLDQNVLINILTAAIQSESGLVKDVAAEALLKTGGDAIPALGKVLKNKSANSLAKRTAATLIGNINQKNRLSDAALQSVIPILAETLSDGDSDVRKAAAGALGDFGPLADVAIPELSRVLLGRNSGGSQTAAGSLVKIGRQSVPGLTAALNSDDPLTRLYAADAIWTLTKDSSLILPTLVSALSDGDVETRELAALGLTYLGRQALPALPAVRNLLGSGNSRTLDVTRLALMILNNKNEPANNLGLLRPEPQTLNSLPAVVQAVNELWR